MRILTILLSLFFIVSGCKTERVGFASAESTEYSKPPAGNDGEGEDDIIRPPMVEITQRPKDHWVGENTDIQYRLIAGDNDIANFICRVDGSSVPCSMDSEILHLNGFELGRHKVFLIAEDTDGLKGVGSARWKISDQLNSQVDNVTVEPGGNKADILFVIDNSKSMSEEQKEMAKRISRFFSQIKQLDWRVGIITTDPYEVYPETETLNIFADGALLKFPNQSYFLDSKLSLSEARKQFAKTIFRPEEGNGHERGIRNTYRAIQRSLDPEASPVNKRLSEFFRSRASFSVVLISDENETTKNGSGVLLDQQHMSQGSQLIDFVNQTWGAQKQFQFNSVIVRPGDQSCISQWEKFGVAYSELSQMTGGVIEDICAEDYSGALKKIGAGVVNLEKIYTLRCAPQDTSSDGRPNVEIKQQSGTGEIPSFQIDGDKLIFSEPLRPGQYQFLYSCLGSVPN